MTVASHRSAASEIPVRVTRAARRFGYTLAALINLAMLFVANHLLEWGWPPWLTGEFERVLPLLSVSLVVAAAWNVAWIAYDAAWFKSIGNIVQASISWFVTLRLLQVFPFDFSAYDVDWATVTRGILVLALLGVSIGLVAESVKLLRAARASASDPRN